MGEKRGGFYGFFIIIFSVSFQKLYNFPSKLHGNKPEGAN